MKQELAILLIVLGFVGILGGYITGFLVAPAAKQVSTAFTQSDFIYNSSEIEITDSIKLNGQTIKIEKNLSNITEYKISNAYFEPDEDKTDNIKEADEKELEINNNKPLYLAFQSDLSSGDSISIKINPNKDSVVNICDFDLGCTKQYSSLIYNNSNQSNTILLSSLESPTKNFLLTTTEEIKIDQIKSSKGDLERAITDPKDRTSKISSQDGDTQNLEDDKLFYLVFESKPTTGSEIKLYITDGEDSKITACSFPSCSISYGSVNYQKSQKGFYNITLNTDPSTNKIVLKSENPVDVDYIKTSLTEKWTEITYNTVYPSAASVETKELSIPNLAFWESIKYSKKDNNQSAKLFYSTENSWLEVPEGNLSSVPVTSKKIKFKIEFTTDTKSTPEISDIKLTYFVKLPSYEEQSIIQESSEKGSIVNITFNATNPSLIDTIYAQIQDSLGKVVGKIKLNYTGEENLFKAQWNTSNLNEGVYSVNLELKSNYTELKSVKDFIALISDVKAYFSSKPVNTGEFFGINAREKASTDLEIKAPSANTTINIIQYSKNIKETYPKEKEVKKYIEIVPEENITNLESVKIKMYYTNQELSAANIEEKTLAIHYYNDVLSLWEKLNSTVNITGKYVEAMTPHFSTYGLFGDENPITQSTQSSSGSSGGGYSSSSSPSNSEPPTKSKTESTKITIEQTSPQQTTTQSKPIQLEKKCNYDISLEIGNTTQKERTGLIHNTGNCDIERIALTATDDIKAFVSIEPETVSNLAPGKQKHFKISVSDYKTTIFLNPLQGLTIASSTDQSKSTIKGKVIIKGIGQQLELPINKEIEVLVEVPQKSSSTPLFPIISILTAIASLLFLAKIIQRDSTKTRTRKK